MIINAFRHISYEEDRKGLKEEDILTNKTRFFTRLGTYKHKSERGTVVSW